MRIWTGLERYPTDRPPVVATVGNFDGVHLGHQAILRDVVETARAAGHSSLLVTFDPHPLSVVSPGRHPDLLQTRKQKLDSLQDTGLDAVLILEFTAEFATLSGREFFASVLGGHLDLRAMHIGGNFRFGRDRAGDADLLREIGEARGFAVVEVPPVEIAGRMVSSSTIRGLLRDGDVMTAAGMLGRPFALQGRVVRGDGRGRTLNFPTANLETHNELIPRTGVYVTEAVLTAARHPAVTNIGFRPTFDGERMTVETHLLDFEGQLYEHPIELRFLDRMRDEVRFSEPGELSDQIARDLAAAEAFFEHGPFPWS